MMMGPLKKIKIFSVETLAYLLIVFFIVIFIVLGIGRHEALKSFQNDLGVYAQILWNTLHGHFFEASGALLAITYQPDGTTLEHFNYLSAHFSPILLLVAPLYAVWPDPKLLIILQAMAVGLGALPVYWLAREKIGRQPAGLVFLAGYLLNPILHNALLYDFHEVALAVPIVTFALWFWHKKRTGWMLFFLFLLLLVQEHTALIVFIFGLYLAFFQKRWKFGLSLAVVSLAYFLIIVTVVIPAFSTTGQSTIIQAAGSDTRYQWLGSSFGEIFSTLIHRPLWVLQNTFKIRQVDFLITLLLPVFGLALFSGLFLLTLPVLAIYFLSQYYLTYSIYFYHSAILIGIIYAAAIFSFARLVKERRWQSAFLALILLSSFLVGYFYSVTPFSAKYHWQDYRPSANAKLLAEVKPLIPAAVALSVQHNLGPHFANRQKLFHFPFMFNKADYVIVDVYNPYADNKKSFFGLRDATEIDPAKWLQAIELLLDNQNFGVIYHQDGWLVFKKGASQELNGAAKQDYLKAKERLGW